ncbi:App1 family protein [Pseudaestuariivita atlantica]|uniref:App1 family protein n=1 Tax=Pseudaestuariivita atlantica TaxID=1317121 RepID=UPI00067C4D56|nr:phosphatase domain-containing protein [Pseudaestuariivita atlantica]
MSFKSALARLVHPIEQVIDSLRPRAMPEKPVIEAYDGFAGPDALHLQGRVLSHVARSDVRSGQSKRENAWQMLRLFFTDEVQGVEVCAGDVCTLSDEEGYVRLSIPRRGLAPGWHDIDVTLPAYPHMRAALPVRVPGPDAPFGVISDIDDTVMQTGAYSLKRNLWTTFTGNAQTRHVFPDALALMQRAEEAGAPVFYVSSSPWNLFGFLREVFARAGLPRGPMFLRDLGISERQFITGTHGDHKGAAIDRILAAHPGLPFVLVGDTGQHDAEVYHAAHLRHPGRIVQVILREPGPGPSDEARAEIDAMRAAGLRVTTGQTFVGMTLPPARPGQERTSLS